MNRCSPINYNFTNAVRVAYMSTPLQTTIVNSVNKTTPYFRAVFRNIFVVVLTPLPLSDYCVIIELVLMWTILRWSSWCLWKNSNRHWVRNILYSVVIFFSMILNLAFSVFIVFVLILWKIIIVKYDFIYSYTLIYDTSITKCQKLRKSGQWVAFLRLEDHHYDNNCLFVI